MAARHKSLTTSRCGGETPLQKSDVQAVYLAVRPAALLPTLQTVQATIQERRKKPVTPAKVASGRR